MTTPILLLLSILLVAIVLMVTERLRADVVALLVALALTVTGPIQPTDTFSGFSRSAVVTIMAVFVLTGGLTMDEAYQSIEWRAVFLIAGMLPVSIAMNRTGAAEYLG